MKRMVFAARKLLRYLQSIVKEQVTRKVSRNKELQALGSCQVWLPVCGLLCGAVCTMSLCAFCCEGQGCTSQAIRFGLWKSSGFERQPQKMVSGRLCFVREGARRGASGTGPSFPRQGLRNWNKSFSVALGFLCARRPMCGGAFLR
jgi:hypothetical protein